MLSARKLFLLYFFSSVLCVGLCRAQTPNDAASPRRSAIRAARLLDGKTDKLVRNATVIVEGDRISAISSGSTIPPGISSLTS